MERQLPTATNTIELNVVLNIGQVFMDQVNAVQELGTHFDKDELHWERTGGQNGGEIITPEIGTVLLS